MKRLMLFAVVVLFAACGGRTFQQRTAKYAAVRELRDGRAAVRDVADTSGRWGFVDADGRLVIECRYRMVGDFSDGRAVAQLPDGLFGYLDSDGKWMVAPTLRSAGDFADGLAWVMNDAGLYGRIDKRGKWILPCLYDQMPMTYAEGLLLVHAEGRWGILRESGEVLVPCVYAELGQPGERGWIPVRRDGKWGYLQLSGEEIVPCKYDRIGDANANGLIPVTADSLHGFLGLDGKEMLPCSYTYIAEFRDGYARVNTGGSMVLREEPVGGCWGVIDSLGKESIPCRYAYLGEPSEGVAAFRVGETGHCGYVDIWGQEVLTPRYAVARPFSGGAAVVSYNNIDFGLVDPNGNEQSSFRYKHIGEFCDGLASFNLNTSGMNFPGMPRRSGYLDHQGREVIPARYDDARPFSERRAAVLRFGVNPEDFFDARWGYIAPTGELVVDYKYHEAYPFSCGLARVYVKGQGYGFIDRKGREIVACKYEAAEDFRDFRVRVRENGRMLMLNEKGEVVGEE